MTHVFPRLPRNADATLGGIQDLLQGPVLRDAKKFLTPKALAKMSDKNVRLVDFRAEIPIIKAPVVREVSADQDNVTRLKSTDAITDELGSFPFFKMDQFDFRMIVPPVIDKRYPVLPYAE